MSQDKHNPEEKLEENPFEDTSVQIAMKLISASMETSHKLSESIEEHLRCDIETREVQMLLADKLLSFNSFTPDYLIRLRADTARRVLVCYNLEAVKELVQYRIDVFEEILYPYDISKLLKGDFSDYTSNLYWNKYGK